MKYLLTALVLSTVAAAPLAAQDAYREGATMDGFRVEARAGLDRPELAVDYDDGVDTFSESDGTSGVAYGGEIGYDFSLGHSVVGVYAGLDFADTNYCSPVLGEDEACLEAGRNITIGVRGASQVARNVLFYVKGGYSNGRVTLDYDDFVDPDFDFRESEELDGYHLGAGGEAALGSNAYVKLEYVYSEYDGYDYEDTDVSVGVGLNRHQVLGGFGLRF